MNNEVKNNLLSDEVFKKYQQRFLEKSKRITNKYLMKLDELSNQPKELDYFKNVLKTVLIDNKFVKYNKDEKLIGSFCVTMPDEIIRAAGARPVRLCNNSYVSNNIGEFFVPADMCPLSKSISGNIYGNINCLYKDVDMFISSFVCDCKKNLFNQLSSYKETMPLYIPYRRNDDDGMAKYVDNLKKIGDRISSLTGQKITKELLRNEILIQTEAQKEILLFSKLKLNEKPLISGSQSLVVMNSLAFDDISNWTKHLKLLNQELLKRKENKEFITTRKCPRILLMGSPISFPNIKVPLIIEQQGGMIVADETCLGERGYIDFVSVTEDTINGYYKALANRYIKPCTCAVFDDSLSRINRIDDIIKNHNIDGIVYHTLNNCLIYDYEYYQIEKHLNKKNIPIIRIESDCGDEDNELINNRICAFLEVIKFKNKED